MDRPKRTPNDPRPPSPNPEPDDPRPDEITRIRPIRGPKPRSKSITDSVIRDELDKIFGRRRPNGS